MCVRACQAAAQMITETADKAASIENMVMVKSKIIHTVEQGCALAANMGNMGMI